MKIRAVTLAGVVGVQVVSRPAGAVVAVRCVGAALAAAPVISAAVLAAAELPRLVLKVAAIVDEVADALQRQAGPPVPAVELCHRVAGDGGSRLLEPCVENAVWCTKEKFFPPVRAYSPHLLSPIEVFLPYPPPLPLSGGVKRKNRESGQRDMYGWSMVTGKH